MKPNDEHPAACDWPDSLIALLERQQEVVGKLGELARYQGTLIETGRTEPLLSLLAQRQKLLDEFTTMQGELSALTENLGQRLSGVADGIKKRIQSLIDEIGVKLSEIMEQDQTDQVSLEQARDRVKQDLAETGAAQQARNAYTTSSVMDTRFADRQG